MKKQMFLIIAVCLVASGMQAATSSAAEASISDLALYIAASEETRVVECALRKSKGQVLWGRVSELTKWSEFKRTHPNRSYPQANKVFDEVERVFALVTAYINDGNAIDTALLGRLERMYNLVPTVCFDEGRALKEDEGCWEEAYASFNAACADQYQLREQMKGATKIASPGPKSNDHIATLYTPGSMRPHAVHTGTANLGRPNMSALEKVLDSAPASAGAAAMPPAAPSAEGTEDGGAGAASAAVARPSVRVARPPSSRRRAAGFTVPPFGNGGLFN